ncbi:hypothetical protein I6N90_13410 [Paenibacillus sp. GSMTC-2017]|uniref:hypothetical protein n=1 Tax=Paenibacillus sp. GSMTC-2017 TaxID=2794350 RepID=UPI0018D5E667|nr:hypothetical protein [Paenibacillus sp. GSMTC-2017]MBH5318799.1 hypothetical protein [Paenibacillus sp. GSMTC-2017]
MNNTIKVIILSVVYLGIFFGTFSWFIIPVSITGFMDYMPTYSESLVGLVIAMLYVNTYILWLWWFFKWNPKKHFKIQLVAFLILFLMHGYVRSIE